jgi:hypothetical protein
VNGARRQLFAGAGLAQDQHGGRGWRHPDGEPIHLLHAGGVADQLAELLDLQQALFERGGAIDQAATLSGLRDGEHDLVIRAERLGQKMISAGTHGLNGRFDVAEGGHHHHLHTVVLAANVLEQLETADLGHHQIDQRDVNVLALQQRDGLRAVVGRQDRATAAL